KYPHGSMGCAPAIGCNEVLQNWRPGRAAQIVARSADGHRNSAPLLKKMGYIGQQRPKGRRSAEADKNTLTQGEDIETMRQRAHKVTCAKGKRPGPDGSRHAAAVGDPPGQNTPNCERNHGQRVERRRLSPGNPEICL